MPLIGNKNNTTLAIIIVLHSPDMGTLSRLAPQLWLISYIQLAFMTYGDWREAKGQR
jgi:hypothetical protein